MDHLNRNFSENPTQFRELMERIEASNAAQEKYARKQYRMSQLTAMFSAVILILVLYFSLTLIPRVHTTLQSVNYMMEDLNAITTELANADLSQMIEDVDHLVVSSEKTVQDALKTLNSLDIETLNQAIQNLNDAVAPLASFFNRF